MGPSGGSEIMDSMEDAHRTIAILDVEAAAAAPHCGACSHDPARGPMCQSVADAAGQAPQLSGPADQVARLMAALTTALRGAPDGAGLVRSLRLQPGEVELRLAVLPHCGGAVLAEAAFQTLRGLLPDTDIFVLPG